jgi:hypothetical protein
VALLLSGLLGVSLLGCGTFRVSGIFTNGAATISGVVTGRQLSSVAGSGGVFIQVTVVTLQQPLGFTTSTFCGNFVSQFPMNSFVDVDFTRGDACSTIVNIVVRT